MDMLKIYVRLWIYIILIGVSWASISVRGNFVPLLILVAVAALDIAVARRKKIKKQAQADINRIRASKIEFYNLCKQNGISEFSTAKSAQKGKLFAEQLDLPTYYLEGIYNEGKKLVQDKENALKEAELNKMRAAEEKEQTELLQFSGLTGRGKRIAMLQAKYNELISHADDKNRSFKLLAEASTIKEKEDKWGYAAGIADAIAGPGAGAAVAIESQMRTAQENAMIREQNRINAELLAPLFINHMREERTVREDASITAEKIEAAKLCLVSDELTSQECFDKLSFSKVNVQQSATGTYTMTAQVNFEAFNIFEDVPAVIDGEVLATIYSRGTEVATVTAVFPAEGAENAKIKGMALYCEKRLGKKQYEVKFSPKRLWAMEAMK